MLHHFQIKNPDDNPVWVFKLVVKMVIFYVEMMIGSSLLRSRDLRNQLTHLIWLTLNKSFE